MNWFVYIILATDGQLYTGITTDIQRRWNEHTSGKAGAKYFRGRAPEMLCFLEAGHTRSTASQREATIKKLNRSKKMELIHNQLHDTTNSFKQLDALTIPLLHSSHHL
jgi:putative endonuclease